jgi:hypothetical protein
VDGRAGLPQLLSRGIDFEIAEAEIQSFPRPKGRIFVDRITGCWCAATAYRFSASYTIVRESPRNLQGNSRPTPARLQVCRAICAYAATNVLWPRSNPVHG